jgi:hypothetical protein
MQGPGRLQNLLIVPPFPGRSIPRRLATLGSVRAAVNGTGRSLANSAARCVGRLRRWGCSRLSR